ncbi:MAG: YjbQ family protein [Candidatus Omnitrophota bacterium]|nr:MAG: YjbQ family protein [Candidatus Omnitrophota bacterium]
MKTKYICFSTKGNCDMVDITSEVTRIAQEEDIENGILFLSAIGSTAALTTMEYEPGLIKDLKQSFQALFPTRGDYAHNFTWADDNAHSHLRSSFVKTHLFVSVTNSKLDLGTWQQIVFIDFDIRRRERKVVVKILT